MEYVREFCFCHDDAGGEYVVEYVFWSCGECFPGDCRSDTECYNGICDQFYYGDKSADSPELCAG